MACIKLHSKQRNGSHRPPGGGVEAPKRPARGGGVAGIREGETSGVGASNGFAIDPPNQLKEHRYSNKGTHVSIGPKQACSAVEVVRRQSGEAQGLAGRRFASGPSASSLPELSWALRTSNPAVLGLVCLQS